MEKKAIPSFEWDEKTEVTKMPKPRIDDFGVNIANIRNALKNRPSLEGYLALIGELLDRRLLDEANQVADEYRLWKKSNK